jgi:hypothetical protein
VDVGRSGRGLLLHRLPYTSKESFFNSKNYGKNNKILSILFNIPAIAVRSYVCPH